MLLGGMMQKSLTAFGDIRDRNVGFEGVTALSVSSTRTKVAWAVIIGLLLTSISLGLLASPDVALQYWYLLAVPIILSALRFGSRGALAVSGISLLVLTITFQSAGRSFLVLVDYYQSLLAATSAREEATDIAQQLVNLRSEDPKTAFLRALAGIAVLVIGGVILGASIDRRERALFLLDKAFNALRQYFSPQVVESIIFQSQALAPVGSARKEITVLFADLRGFTALSEQIQAEETAELLNEFFTVMTEEVFREDGTLDKFIGDCLMVVYGDPVSYDDHIERACRTALAMQARMKVLQKQWEDAGRPSLGMGIGINTGFAVVGNTGSPTRKDYTAIGSSVNAAARFTDLAKAGEILIGRKAYYKVRHLFEGIEKEPTQVKGFSEPMEIVALRGVRQTVGEVVPVEEDLVEVVGKVLRDSNFRQALLTDPGTAASQHNLDKHQQKVAVYVANLADTPLFNGIPFAQLAYLMDGVEESFYSQGSIVVAQGTVATSFFLILNGQVKVTMKDEDGAEHDIGVLGMGDYFGEMGIVFDTLRSATAHALTPLVVLKLEKEAFYDVIAHAPAVQTHIEGTAKQRFGQPTPSNQPST